MLFYQAMKHYAKNHYVKSNSCMIECAHCVVDIDCHARGLCTEIIFISNKHGIKFTWNVYLVKHGIYSLHTILIHCGCDMLLIMQLLCKMSTKLNLHQTLILQWTWCLHHRKHVFQFEIIVKCFKTHDYKIWQWASITFV